MECRDDDDGALSWSIPSSSGRELVKCTPLRWWTTPDGAALALARLSMTGQFWERDRFERKETEYDLVDDYRIVLPQVVVSRGALEALHREVEAWLAAPKEISVDLSGTRHQSIEVTLRADPRFISRVDRPVCDVRYSAGAGVAVERRAIVDETCVRLLRDDLARLLSAPTG